ncbi:alpha/beta hydrolase [Chelatococcus sp.]|uniref:alpha/beta hydrolase n=1 Tax=Chelatococcus sp. TaxID=1953771 RepID=UPI0025B9E413|nr:alpha/beta hydrolase [Chelatococcus sp.]
MSDAQHPPVMPPSPPPNLPPPPPEGSFPGLPQRPPDAPPRVRRNWRRLVALVIGAIALAYLAAVGALYSQQRHYLFPLDPARTDPAVAGIPGLTETTISTEDGETLVAWVLPPQEGKPVLLYFHGQSGNLARPGRLDRYKALSEDGEGLFIVSYRGYGGSTGSPSEEGLRADARAAYKAAAERFGAERLVAYGESLGTGVAVGLAAEVPLKGVILESPYTSTAEVGAARYPWAPVKLLMRDPFRSDDLIGKIRAPLLILHGLQDHIIPYAQGVALFNLAPGPKRLVSFVGGGHVDLPDHGSIPQITMFLRDIDGATPLPEAQTRVVREILDAPEPAPQGQK